MVTIQYESGLTLYVEPNDEKYEQFLALDTTVGNDDGVVDAEDLGGNERELIDVTASIFFPADTERGAAQTRGFGDFVSLYGNIVRFGEFVEYLDRNKLNDNENGELELNESDATYALDQMVGETAPFTPLKIGNIAYNLRYAFRKLEGSPLTAEPKINDTRRKICGDPSITGFGYDKDLVPEFLAAEMKYIAETYLTGVNILRQYDRIEHDENVWLPVTTWIDITKVSYLATIETNNSYDIWTEPCRTEETEEPPCGPGQGRCLY